MADSDNNSNGIGRVEGTSIIEEMQRSYLDYAMSVIVSRALPDVRDGLKPVQRRIVYAMQQQNLHHTSRYQKSAAVVGEVLKSFHPHGDVPVYDAMVRMAQDFSMRYTLVDGQGNFGCFTIDTKIRLTDGRNLSFEGLIEEQSKGRRHWTFSFNHQLGKIEVEEIKQPRLTRKDAELVEVELDNAEKIKCTPDHRFMLRDGSYRQAKDLQPGDSLMPLYSQICDGAKDKNLKGYERISQPFADSWQFTHHLSDEWNLKHQVYEKKAGRIRHHANFNKLNNDPENIVRLQWADHFKIHYEMASWRHKNDPEYVKKIAEGRQKFIQANHEKLSIRTSARNHLAWQDPKYRQKKTESIKKMWLDEAYRARMQQVSSQNLKKLWQNEDFKQLLSNLKSEEMKKRWQDPKYRLEMQKQMKEISNKIWSDPEHRKYISELMIERTSESGWKKAQSQITKKLWQDPNFRAKYPADHFRKMALSLWADENIREMHRKKIAKQREDPIFIEKNRQGVVSSNNRRLQENPKMMTQLAAKAKVSLQLKWQDPAYKKQVVKSKVLGYVSGLLQKYPLVTPQIYEKERINNGVPKIDRALEFFDDFSSLVGQAQNYNHKVVRVVVLEERQDVYDLTIDSLHNFALAAGIFVHNSVDGDSPAAMRYTEARLSAIADELLRDINKNTVDFVDNYSGTVQEPMLLPSVIPNLLLNGASGIAVGMATQIPPHNLGEVTDALISMIENPVRERTADGRPQTATPIVTATDDREVLEQLAQSGKPVAESGFKSELTVEDLIKLIKGPDFPTGASIYDQSEILAAYATGKGRIVMRAKAEIEEARGGRFDIIITELPYQVNKAVLIARIADMVRDKKIDGISDLRDESDRKGMRMVIELKRDAKPQSVLNNLYKHTALQSVFNVNMVALSDGVPHLMTLKRVLEEFVTHRMTVVRRRSEFELGEARAREHILEGLKIAVDNIDEVIETIRKSADAEIARTKLMSRFKLSELQATAILDMQLRKLAALERKRIEDELKMMQELIAYLVDLLAHPDKMLKVIKDELIKVRDRYADDRRTRVYKQKIGEFSEEDLVADETMIVTVTRGGYVKRQSPMSFRTQNRGGKGVSGITTKDEDAVSHIFYTQTLDNLLFFTDKGRVFQIKVWEIPEASRTAKGQAIVNLINVEPSEKMTAILTTKAKDKTKFLFMCTRKGSVKKTPVEEYANIRKNGLISIKLDAGDQLCWVVPTLGNQDVILVTRDGQSIRFAETQVRGTHRDTSGVRGISLTKSDELVSMNLVQEINEDVLVVMENGLGKKTKISAWKRQSRGGSGIKAAQITDKTGKIVTAEVINAEFDTLVMTSNKGQLIKLSLKDVPTLQRQTQGVILMRVRSGEVVAAATVVSAQDKVDGVVVSDVL